MILNYNYLLGNSSKSTCVYRAEMGYSYDHTWSLLNGRKTLSENHKTVLIELLEIPILSKDTENT